MFLRTHSWLFTSAIRPSDKIYAPASASPPNHPKSTKKLVDLHTPPLTNPHKPCFPKGKQSAHCVENARHGECDSNQVQDTHPWFALTQLTIKAPQYCSTACKVLLLFNIKAFTCAVSQFERHRLCVDSLDSSGVSAVQLLPLGAQHSILCLIRIHPLSQLLKGVLKRTQEVLLRRQVLIILFQQCLPTCRCW